MSSLKKRKWREISSILAIFPFASAGCRSELLQWGMPLPRPADISSDPISRHPAGRWGLRNKIPKPQTEGKGPQQARTSLSLFLHRDKYDIRALTLCPASLHKSLTELNTSSHPEVPFSAQVPPGSSEWHTAQLSINLHIASQHREVQKTELRSFQVNLGLVPYPCRVCVEPLGKCTCCRWLLCSRKGGVQSPVLQT